MQDENIKVDEKVFDVLIVGAGLSGLTSAVKILSKEKTLKIRILEATSHIGGKIGENPIGENGAKWVNEEQEHMMRLLRTFKVSPRRRVALGAKLKRCWDIDRGFWALPAKYELNRYINELEMRMQYYRPGRFKTRTVTMTMEKHISNRLFFRKSRKFMLNLVMLVCGADASEVTYEEFMGVSSTCGGLYMLMDIYLKGPNTLQEISSGVLLQGLLDKLRFVEILLKHTVVAVKHFKDYVEVRDMQGSKHCAETVILAIPWNDIETIYFSPPIPTELRRLPKANPHPRRHITSFIAKYGIAHWSLKGYSGNFLDNGDPFIVGYEYRPTTYTGIVIHDIGEKQNMRSLVLQKLSRHFGREMTNPLEFYEYTYEMSSALNMPLTTPWNRVIWSSSSTAGTTYRNCLNGAVQSGLRAAVNTLLLIRPQSLSWQDIMELEYCNPYLHVHNSWFDLFFSTWNLYNVAFYSVFVAGLLVLLERGYTGFTNLN